MNKENYFFKEDKILQMLFQVERFKKAVEKGCFKGINKDALEKFTMGDYRYKLYRNIAKFRYKIWAPHTAKIPKPASPGEFRTVYANIPRDRILLTMINDLLFELCPEMVHKTCKSYLTGIGCGMVVKECSRHVFNAKGKVIGFKSDLSKYFDSVPIRFIDEIFDRIEQKHGYSAVIQLLRDYYHKDEYWDSEKKCTCYKFQSLKQGCAVAAFLADVIIYHIDEKLSKDFGCFYVRYCDDMLCIGENYMQAMECLKSELEKMDMTLNPKKVEYLSKDRWFRFLGFTIRGQYISLAKDTIKIFCDEIRKRTIESGHSFDVCLKDVNDYLYRGNGTYSWSTRVLPIVNVIKDINKLNNYVLDHLRAVKTKKMDLYGLGYIPTQEIGVIGVGTGANVTSNRKKTEKIIKGYITLNCARKMLLSNVNLYHTAVNSVAA